MLKVACHFFTRLDTSAKQLDCKDYASKVGKILQSRSQLNWFELLGGFLKDLFISCCKLYKQFLFSRIAYFQV